MKEFNKLVSTLPPVMGLNGDKGPRLFHYTTNAGLIGIVTSKTLRATQIQYLNDSEEFSHGLLIAAGVARDRAKAASGREKLLLETISSSWERVRRTHVFVSSFTENGDLLSQWRGYAGAGGVSLSFSYGELIEIANKNANGFRLIKCVYEEKQKRLIAGEFIDEALTSLQNLGSEVSEEIVKDLSWTFLKRFQQIAACFKNHAFKEEAEWRLVSLPVSGDTANIDFRSTAAVIIPFFTMNLDLGKTEKGKIRIGIQELLIGPSSYYEEQMAAISLLFQRSGVYVATLSRTLIPFRQL